MKRQAQARKKLRLLLAAVAATALLSAAACAVAVRDEAPREEVTAKELASQGHRPFMGPVGVVIDVAKSHGGLTAEQEQAIRVLSQDLEADLDGRREAGDRLRASAIAVVRAGRADPAALDRAVSDATRAVEQRMQRGTEALVEVHAVLEPEQRAAIAVELRRRITEKYRSHAERHDRRGFERAVAHLTLSALQVEQLKRIKKELVGDREQLHPSRDELFELAGAFETDDFATALDTFREKKSRVLRARLTDASRRTDAVLGIFTPAQRELLADLLKDGPQKVLLGQGNRPTP